MNLSQKLASFFLCTACGLVSTSSIGQQAPPRNVDVNSYTPYKYFYDVNSTIEDMWTQKEHDCPDDLPKEWDAVFENSVKHTQGYLESVFDGNVSISMQKLFSMEKSFIDPVRGLDHKTRDMITTCIGGFKYPLHIIESESYDYYDDFVKIYRAVRKLENRSYRRNGRSYSFRIIRDEKDIQEAWNNPTVHGTVLTLGGIHNFTKSIYLRPDIVNSKEAVQWMLKSIERLKGIRPLIDNTEEYITAPILAIEPAWFFPNGMIGNINRSSKFNSRLFGGDDPSNLSVTEVGRQAIERLVDKEHNGNRILIDVSAMSMHARQWYYEFLNAHLYDHPTDTIPILATNTSISGKSWSDAGYARTLDARNSKSYLQHNQASLSAEDLTAIARTRGLIGITIDGDFLLHYSSAKTDIAKVMPESYEHRQRVVELIAANICRVIEVLSDRQAWDLISISTNNDLNSPFFCYTRASDLPDLRKDLLNFFKSPRAIGDLYTAQQVQSFMYDYSPEELVDKIMGRNAYDFIWRYFTVINKPTQNSRTVERK